MGLSAVVGDRAGRWRDYRHRQGGGSTWRMLPGYQSHWMGTGS